MVDPQREHYRRSVYRAALKTKADENPKDKDAQTRYHKELVKQDNKKQKNKRQKKQRKEKKKAARQATREARRDADYEANMQECRERGLI